MFENRVVLGEVLVRSRLRGSRRNEIFGVIVASFSTLALFLEVLSRRHYISLGAVDVLSIVLCAKIFFDRCMRFFPSWGSEYLKVTFNRRAIYFEQMRDDTRFKLRRVRWSDVERVLWSSYDLIIVERQIGRRWTIPSSLLSFEKRRDSLLALAERATSKSKVSESRTELALPDIAYAAFASTLAPRDLLPVAIDAEERTRWRRESIFCYSIAMTMITTSFFADALYEPKRWSLPLIGLMLAWVAPSIASVSLWQPEKTAMRHFEFNGRWLKVRVVLNDVELWKARYPWFWFKSAKWKGDSLVLTPWVGGDVVIPDTAFENDVDRNFFVDVVKAPLTAKLPIQRA